MGLIKKILLLTVSLLLISCKTKKDDLTVIPADTLYHKGEALMAEKKYKDSAEEFSKIYFQHPGSELAPRAEIMQAYALYLASKYEEAIDVLDNFTKLHPIHEDISYVFYLKALCYYMDISDSEHDQGKTVSANFAFLDVINRFPNSKYAIDSNLKLDLVRDHLSSSEMNVGRFYLKKRNPIAAIKRFQYVVQNYQTTNHITEALYRMVECYVMLGIKEEASKYSAVLGHNYPDSEWYNKAYILVHKE